MSRPPTAEGQKRRAPPSSPHEQTAGKHEAGAHAAENDFFAVGENAFLGRPTEGHRNARGARVAIAMDRHDEFIVGNAHASADGLENAFVRLMRDNPRDVGRFEIFPREGLLDLLGKTNDGMFEDGGAVHLEIKMLKFDPFAVLGPWHARAAAGTLDRRELLGVAR